MSRFLPARLFTSKPLASLRASLALLTFAVIAPVRAAGPVGADLPWTTYEAEEMSGTGTVLGPTYEPFRVETESSHQKCVRLAAAGEYVEFTAIEAANTLVLRFNLPDAPEGGGTTATLLLYVNGQYQRTLTLSSRHAWLYGTYPFSNRPADGKPRNFYDELRLKHLTIAPGDVLRLSKANTDEPACIVDLVDLENVAPPRTAPANALSVLDFGAGGRGETDDTNALRACIAEAQRSGRVVWVPAGDYRLTGDILVPSSVRIQGAGLWHTTFLGDETLYAQSDRRVRFKLVGRDCHLADFAIIGALNYRNDDEPNDGVVGEGCSDASVSRVWVEHTKAGVWVYNGTRLRIDGCRFRNLLADGVNLCVGTSESVIQNCSSRGTGDDCFAIWPAALDQGYVGQTPQPGHNVIRRCTGQLTFLANGASLYGGASNRVEDCLFTDIATGCGLLISTTFLTADEQRGIDNNFSGETTVRNNRLVRCGGYDHSWTWRGSVQICLQRRSISGLTISDLDVVDSLSDGVTVIAPGRGHGQGTLTTTRLERVRVGRVGLGAPGRHGLWIRQDVAGRMTLLESAIADIRNDSPDFELGQK